MPFTSRSILYSLIQKEIRLAYRDKILVLLFGITWILFITSAGLSLYQYNHDTSERKESNLKFRKQWEAQQRNPHAAAHFGTYLFKPITLLNAFDTGLNDYFGTSYRVEAHVQHEVDYSNAENNDATLRFGQFNLALVLQLLVPLLILFTASSALTSERELGTYKMLLAQGIKPNLIAWGKVFASYSVTILLVLPIFIILFSLICFSSSTLLITRLLLILCSYLIYYLVITILAVLVSAHSSSSKSAMLIGLIFWLSASIILPKAATELASRLYPPMTRATFTNGVKQAYLKGLNGRDPYVERGERHLRQLLLQYQVNSPEQLPVDAAAIIMQYNEDYQNKVFDHYNNQIESTFKKQQSFLNIAGFSDPFLSLKRISMAFSGTDYFHHNEFFIQARQYRNQLIRTLNLEMASHPAKAKDDDQKGPEFFRQMKDFNYRVPDTKTILSLQLNNVFSLCLWLIMMSLSLQWATKRN